VRTFGKRERNLKTTHSETALSYDEIARHLAPNNNFSITILNETDSTNTRLKKLAENGASEWTVLFAEHQTAGKGRLNRTFVSPKNTGIYMSFLIRPALSAPSLSVSDTVLLTTCAAASVYEAIKTVTAKETAIKWVNDLYYNKKKVCGILAEGALTKDAKALEYAVIGIGINVSTPNFDEELSKIATGLFSENECENIGAIRNRLCAEILKRFRYYYETQLAVNGAKRTFIDVYRSKMFLYGKKVDVFVANEVKEATVLSLNDDCSLNIEYPDGSRQALSYGEVQIKLK